LAVLLVVGIGFILAYFSGWFADRNPASCAVEGNSLQVFNSEGDFLWQYSSSGLVPIRPPEPQAIVHLIADLDGDGKNEVAYIFSPPDPQAISGKLICFDHDGKHIWEVDYGKRLRFVGQELVNWYFGGYLTHVEVDKRIYLVTIALQRGRFPSQVLLIEPDQGTIVDEYYHPGYLRKCLFKDFDEDGKNEVLLAGINNPGAGIGHAAAVILDLPFSTSVHTDFFGNLGPREMAYLVFPRTRIGTLNHHKPFVLLINNDQENLYIETGQGGIGNLHYTLDRQLRLVDFRASDTFQTTNREAELDGVEEIDLPPYERLSRKKVLPTATLLKSKSSSKVPPTVPRLKNCPACLCCSRNRNR